MKKDLFTILKELKNIKSDPDYSRRSRLLILGEDNPLKTGYLSDFFNILSPLRWALASEVIGVLIVVAATGFYFSGVENKNNMVVQANEINASIQLRLNEIKYFIQGRAPSSPKEASNMKNSLTRAADELKIAQAYLEGDKMEESLNSIKEAERIFLEIETKIKEAENRDKK